MAGQQAGRVADLLRNALRDLESIAADSEQPTTSASNTLQLQPASTSAAERDFRLVYFIYLKPSRQLTAAVATAVRPTKSNRILIIFRFLPFL